MICQEITLTFPDFFIVSFRPGPVLVFTIGNPLYLLFRIIWACGVNAMRRNCTPAEMSYLATSFAVSIAKGQDIRTLRMLCSFFTSVIATLNVIINQKLACEPLPEKKEK